MFHHPASPQAQKTSLRDNPFLKRAALFGGALLLLFVAFQLLPSTPPDPTNVYSDTSGTIATKPDAATRPPRSGSSFGFGYLMAIALLGGGALFALYLRKRNGAPGASPASMQTIGIMQISAGQQLRLVSCAGEVLLLGVTSSQISLLRTFPAEIFVDTSGGSTPTDEFPRDPGRKVGPNPPLPNSFATLLQQFSATAPTQPQPTSR